MSKGSLIGRRGFLAGLAGAGAVAIIGFDPVARTWIPEARAASACTPFPLLATVPPLDGLLFIDAATCQGDATDEGNIAYQVPCAVLRPGSDADIQKMIRFCRSHGIQVAARGQHHTMFGQGLTCGLLIEMRTQAVIHSIGPDYAVADAGVLWKDLFNATVPYGLRPVTTGYLGLTIGGTLSVGGCPQSTNHGALVDNVRELTVVTGKGDIVTCSEAQHSDLFEAMLGGLGQCGVITRATVGLLPAPPMARFYRLDYVSTAPLFSDLRTMINRNVFDECYSLCLPPGSSAFLYGICAAIFFDPSSPPNDDQVLAGLNVPPSAVTKVDMTIQDYVLWVDNLFDVLRLTMNWDALIKPWFDVWLPDSTVEGYVTNVLANLTPEDVGCGGFLLVLPQRRSLMTRPFFKMPDPDGSDWVFLFDVLTSSSQPGPNPSFVQRMLARNRAWFDQARALGAKRYPIGAITFSRDDWVQHYGDSWARFAQNKQQYDPANVMTPGPGIF